jgi:hypothetical protein
MQGERRRVRGTLPGSSHIRIKFTGRHTHVSFNLASSLHVEKMRRNSTKNRSRTPYGSTQHEPGARLAVGATTAWEVYNDRAFETDKERIKDWNDSLNTLLIFVRKSII